MSRFAVVGGMLVLAGALTVGSAPPKPAPAPAAPAAPQVPAKGENPGLAALRTVFPELPEVPADPQTKLSNMLNALSQRLLADFKLQVHFFIKSSAFENEGVKEVSELAIVSEKPLPAAANISVERYLKRILERVTEKGPIPSGVTFVVRKEHIEITTASALRKEIWGDHPGPFLALVNASFEKKPLEDALKELADQTEHNIVLDARVAEKAKTIVTARFANTPLDTATALLADMADLQPILQDNVIYVTTRENVLRWEARHKKEMKDLPADDAEMPRIGRVGPGTRGLPQPSAPAAGAGMQ